MACDGNFYPVHKFVLSTCSEYFDEIFERTQCKHPFIIVKDIQQSDLEALLSYMYKGEVNVPQSTLSGLIKAAESLRIKGLAVCDSQSFEDGSQSNSKERKRKRKEGSGSTAKSNKKKSSNIVSNNKNSLGRNLDDSVGCSGQSEDNDYRNLEASGAAPVLVSEEHEESVVRKINNISISNYLETTKFLLLYCGILSFCLSEILYFFHHLRKTFPFEIYYFLL